MPRWREKPDYRHLRDVTDEAALLNAIRSPTYGDGHDFRLLAGFQARLVAMWGDRDLLALAELVPAHEDVRARDPGFFGHGRNWQGAFLHDAVGNLVGWGLRLGVLREAPNPGGDRLFLLEIREPLFERVGNGRWRKVDARRGSRGAGARETYRVKHAAKIEPLVKALVGEWCDTGMEIPAYWFRRLPDQLARLQGLAVLVADARTTFETIHRDMHLADQKMWIRMLRKRPASERMKPIPDILPDEDIEALGSLV